MANKWYPKAKEAMMNGDLALDSDDIIAILVDTASYSYNDAHEFLSEIPVGERVAISSSLTNKTTTNAVFDSDDLIFASVVGDPSEALVLVQDSGNPATSRLVMYVDTATGLPVDPDGTNINVQVNASGWGAL